jgi:hypothetical protein
MSVIIERVGVIKVALAYSGVVPVESNHWLVSDDGEVVVGVDVSEVVVIKVGVSDSGVDSWDNAAGYNWVIIESIGIIHVAVRHSAGRMSNGDGDSSRSKYWVVVIRVVVIEVFV